MPEFLLFAAAVILLMVAGGLIRILRGPADVDRIMAVQLLGTGGIAALLLGTTTSLPGAVDVALVLALLAAFAAVIFVTGLDSHPDSLRDSLRDSPQDSP
jgi:multicomponent Na+:H+ antiporter subunit F